MPSLSSGLQARPFNEIGPPLTFVACSPQQDARLFLQKAVTGTCGVTLLHGPEGVGKTTLARQFARHLGQFTTTAYVDAEGLYASQLLSKILASFGYDVSLNSTDELLNLLQVFLVQQTQSKRAPVLVVDNLDRMFPGALSALCKVAAFKAKERHALHMILVSDADSQTILRSASMVPIADRVNGAFEMRPLTVQESHHYVYTKLRAAGVAQPDDVLPVMACDKIAKDANGFPGRIDRAAAHYLEHGDSRSDAPRLVVTRDGSTLQDVELVANRLLVGRSELCDILLSDQFVSKHHALFVWNDDTVILLDLKSSNGTFVNSKRAQAQVLHHNDVVMIGDHRIKLIFEKAGTRSGIDDGDLSDTSKMKGIADARRAKALRDVTLRAIGDI